jgi:hypothetical protein
MDTNSGLGNVEARKPSDSGPAFPTREGGRRRSSHSWRHRSIHRPGKIHYGSMLGEAYCMFWLIFRYVFYDIIRELNATMLMIYNSKAV